MDSKRTTGLITPRRVAAPKDTFLDNPKEVSNWAANLPIANLGETSRRVFKTLVESNRIDIPRLARLKTAELFHQPIEYISNNLRKYYFDVPQPLSERNRKIAILNRELYSELAIAYKTFIKDDLAANHPPQSRDALKIALSRALLYLGQVLYQSAIIYDPYPKNVWAEIHLLYQYAQKLELLHFQDERGENKEVPSSIEAIYRRILLFSLSSPYRLRQREIEYIYNHTSSWQALTSITEMKPADNVEGIFIIHSASDISPIHLNLETRAPSKRSRQFHTQKLIAFLKKEGMRPAIEREKSERKAVSSDLSKTLFERLINGLREAPKRDSIRTKNKFELNVVVGLSAVHDYLIAHLRPKPPADPVEQSEVDSVDWLEEYQRVGNPGFKEAINHLKGAKFSLSPEQDFSTEETIIETHHVDSDSEYAPAWASNQKKKHAAPYTFHSINESAGGYCISWQGENPPHIKVGEIIGVQSETIVESNAFAIGISRWIRNTPNIGLQLGMELISPSAKAVFLSYINPIDGIDQQYPALLLTQLHATSQPDNLIVPTLPFKLNDELWLADGPIRYEIVLSGLHNSSGAFSQFEFKKLDTSGTKNKEEEQTEEVDFDTIWPML